MDEPLAQLKHVGGRAAAALEAYASERTRARERARRGFLEAALGASDSPRPLRNLVVGMAALALVIAVVVVRTPTPLAFTADGVTGSVQSWVAAPGTRPVVLSFSDGSLLRLDPTSRARVVAIDANGASVALENGVLHASVVHLPRSAWRMIAGPYTVRVTGTRFDVHWNAATEEFSLTVVKGSVIVSGPPGTAEHRVVGGETLEVSSGAAGWKLGPTANREAEPAPTEGAAVPSASVGAEVARVGTSAAGAPADSSNGRLTERSESTLEWKRLCAKGFVKEAFQSAETSGFDAACASASPGELMKLADGARLSGHGDRAVQALTALRSRYPGDARRAAAAFLLGKVSFDQKHDYAQAARWFSTSIREQPDGSLAREAAGRLIEALRNGGDEVGARRAAQEYLSKYPNGPHAGIARSVLQ